MKINQDEIQYDEIQYVRYFWPRTPNEEQSFILRRHIETNTAILQEGTENSLDDIRMPYLLRCLVPICKSDTLVLRQNKKGNGFDKITYTPRIATGRYQTTIVVEIVDVKIEFYAKDLTAHKVLYAKETK